MWVLNIEPYLNKTHKKKKNPINLLIEIQNPQRKKEEEKPRNEETYFLTLEAKKTFGFCEYNWKVSPIYGQPKVPGGSGNFLQPVAMNLTMYLSRKKKKKMVENKKRKMETESILGFSLLDQ